MYTAVYVWGGIISRVERGEDLDEMIVDMKGFCKEGNFDGQKDDARIFEDGKPFDPVYNYDDIEEGLKLEDIEIGKTYKIRPIKLIKSGLHNAPVKVTKIRDEKALPIMVTLEEKRRGFNLGQTLFVNPGELEEIE